MPRKAQLTADVTPDLTLGLEITLDNLTIGDLRVFAALKNGTADELAMIDLLNRCVAGGIEHLPLSKLAEVATALANAIKASQNPNS